MPAYIVEAALRGERGGEGRGGYLKIQRMVNNTFMNDCFYPSLSRPLQPFSGDTTMLHS